ncbi:protein RRNAD1 isoform X2 [Phasianus colchicus]|uniref:Ribosomal RNA adenine dimethylase domain containing 1 n=1 Tax=Phasianus colchicus TaxID=9054 RepID=A0A669R237_PHACC|nr:protein RRNAD1 isoform X2 [Phasianus colchicus]
MLQRAKALICPRGPVPTISQSIATNLLGAGGSPEARTGPLAAFFAPCVPLVPVSCVMLRAEGSLPPEDPGGSFPSCSFRSPPAAFSFLFLPRFFGRPPPGCGAARRSFCLSARFRSKCRRLKKFLCLRFPAGTRRAGSTTPKVTLRMRSDMLKPAAPNAPPTNGSGNCRQRKRACNFAHARRPHAARAPAQWSDGRTAHALWAPSGRLRMRGGAAGTRRGRAVTSQRDITAMAGAPRPSLHWEQQRAANIVRLLSLYRPLLDSYIIDFFTEGLWAKLPPAWQAALEVADPPQLAAMLLGTGGMVGQGAVWPLSLLAFTTAVHALSFPRGQLGGASRPPCQSPHLHPLLRRHVKPKKQHEIWRLGKVLQRLSQATGCERVVDVGAGQGHLTRFLAFSLGLSVTAVEGDGRLVSLAEHFDQELLRELGKAQARADSRRLPHSQHHPNTDPTDPASLCPRCPQHVAGWLDPQAPGQEFLLAPTPGPALAARNPLAWPVDSEQVLLTGLHACGDLSVALLRHFVCSPQVAAVTSAACCYMKLSTCPEPTASSLPGYPLSAWVAGLPGHTLSYRAREAACHAVEEYTERLRRDSECLRIHCYRAVLETLIQAADPSKKHLGVQTVKKAHTLSFPEYARLGLTLVGLDSAAVPLDSESVCAMLCQQHKVVAFFSLVLLLAPLVETLILLDRILYLREQGFQCALVPLFNPRFSPRNLVLVAARVPLDAVLSGLDKDIHEDEDMVRGGGGQGQG